MTSTGGHHREGLGDPEDHLRKFRQVWKKTKNNPRELQRIDDLIDLLDTEEALYTHALAALDRGDRATAIPLLRHAAQAGIGDAEEHLADLVAQPPSRPEPEDVDAVTFARYSVPPDAQPRRVRVDSDGALYGEVPLVAETAADHRVRTSAVPSRMGSKPDPVEARTAAEFVEVMRRYRYWAGNPSCRTLSQQCGGVVSAAAFSSTLHGTELPRFTILNAFILACGGSEPEFQRWISAWRHIACNPPQQQAQVLNFPDPHETKTSTEVGIRSLGCP
jgi:hypothetical protein